jgi:hypothetical protein
LALEQLEELKLTHPPIVADEPDGDEEEGKGKEAEAKEEKKEEEKKEEEKENSGLGYNDLGYPQKTTFHLLFTSSPIITAFCDITTF